MASPGTVVVDGDRVTVTVDLATARLLCGRVAAARSRLARLDARIHGGAEVIGSVTWVEAKAAAAGKAGNERLADRLDRRADRRAEVGERIRRAMTRLDRVDDTVCSAIRDAG